MKTDEYINKNFGDYYVIERVDDHITANGFRKPRFKCRCKCGVEDIVSTKILDKNPSCKHIDDNIGKTFGNITVLRRNDILNQKTGYKIKSYDCQCICGKIFQVRSSNLTRTNSCGCLWKHDYVGQKFGRLTVTSKAESQTMPSGQQRTMWNCICECGNKVTVSDTELTQGRTKSCGCLQKELQSQKMKKYNIYDLSGDFGIGYTNNMDSEGRNYFYFDLDDYEKIKNYCWFFNSTDYLSAKLCDGTDKHILLHKLLIPGNDYIDHIKHNKFDNRKSQLRPVTNGQNQMNKSIQKNNSSGVAGVNWHNRDNVWEVHIGVDKKQLYLGRYNDFNEAVKVRREAEEKYFGDYSYDNSQAI